MHKKIPLLALPLILTLPICALAQSVSVTEQMVNGLRTIDIHCQSSPWTENDPITVFQKDGKWQQLWRVNQSFLPEPIVEAYQGLAEKVLAERICGKLEQRKASASNAEIRDCADPGTVGGGLHRSNCRKKAELAKGKEEIAKGKEEIAKIRAENDQLVEILAMLNPVQSRAYVTEEIQKAEKALVQARESNNQRRVVSLEDRLRVLRERQKTLK